MRKCVTVLLTMLMIGLMVGCNMHEPLVNSENVAGLEDMTTVSFDAEISAINKSTYLVIPLKGSEELKSADKFEVAIKNLEPSPEPEVGDVIRIVYDGNIAETYPAKIDNVYSISVVEEKNNAIAESDLNNAIMVNGMLYFDTGRESDVEVRCGVMDGTIETTIDQTALPTKDNESNFGIGFGWQYGSEDGLIEVHIGDKWFVFATEEKKQEILALGKDAVDYGVAFMIEDITPTGGNIVIIQKDGNFVGELSTGSWYILETWTQEKGWQEAPYFAEVAWTEEAWTIANNEISEWPVDWTRLYGELPPGKYRISKEILNVREPGDYDKVIVTDEFEISEQ